jgi:DNA-binding NarL/FixJ family response regulator
MDLLARLLEGRFDVVARVGTGRALVEAVVRLSPAVVLTDIAMPELNGIEAVRQITATYPAVKAVICSVHDDPTFIEAAFEAGASAYIVKSGASADIISAIEDVLAGRMRQPDAPQNR